MKVQVSIELNEDEIRNLIAIYLQRNYSLNIAAKDVPIQVKSKQNYRSEWEEAAIRVNVTLSQ